VDDLKTRTIRNDTSIRKARANRQKLQQKAEIIATNPVGVQLPDQYTV
jgi:hypothetical protein